MESLQQFVAAYLEGLDTQATVLKQKVKAGEALEAQEVIDFVSLATIRLRDMTAMLAGVIDELRQDAPPIDRRD